MIFWRVFQGLNSWIFFCINSMFLFGFSNFFEEYLKTSTLVYLLENPKGSFEVFNRGFSKIMKRSSLLDFLFWRVFIDLHSWIFSRKFQRFFVVETFEEHLEVPPRIISRTPKQWFLGRVLELRGLQQWGFLEIFESISRIFHDFFSRNLRIFRALWV